MNKTVLLVSPMIWPTVCRAVRLSRAGHVHLHVCYVHCRICTVMHMCGLLYQYFHSKIKCSLSNVCSWLVKENRE